MSITIGSNIGSLRGQRQLARSSTMLAASLERLSSGRRINRAADDAAGLAIAEQLHVDARLSHAARCNINDGISAINILTGALESQKTVLLRMAELAEHEANGTYTSGQRAALDQEYQQLMLEFDRIANTTTFNGVSLLRDRDEGSVQIMAGINGSSSALLELTRANSHRFAGTLGLRLDYDQDLRCVADDVLLQRTSVIPEKMANDTSGIYQDYGVIDVVDSQGGHGKLRVLLGATTVFQGSMFWNGMKFYTHGGLDEPFVPAVKPMAQADRDDGDTTGLLDLSNISASADHVNVSFSYANSGATASVGIDLSGISYDLMDWERPVRNTVIGFTNLESAASCRRAVDTVTNRVDDLSALQGEYGALLARLEVSGKILQVSGESLAAAESRIRDADIADEAGVLTRSEILQRASGVVLAQANMQPSIALRLLGN